MSFISLTDSTLLGTLTRATTQETILASSNNVTTHLNRISQWGKQNIDGLAQNITERTANTKTAATFSTVDTKVMNISTAIALESSLSQVFNNYLPLINLMQEYTGCRIGVSFKYIPYNIAEDVFRSFSRNTTYVNDSNVLSTLLFSSIDTHTGLIKLSLIESLQKTIHTTDISIIGETLDYLLRKCGEGDQSLIEGYLFLALLYMALYRSPQGACIGRLTFEEVKDHIRTVLSTIDFADFASIPHPHRVVELLFFRYSRIGNYLLLPYFNNANTMIDFTIHTLCTRSFSSWPNKGKFLLSLFEYPLLGNRDLPHCLQNATCDNRTREVGTCFAAAFQAQSYTAAIQPLLRAKELLPSMNQASIAEIFRRPLISFQDCFSRCESKMVAENSVLIGRLSQRPACTGNAPMNTYLLAYNMQTERLIWREEIQSIPWREFRPAPRCISSQLTRLGIVLMYTTKDYLRILETETGTERFRITLPAIPESDLAKIYITETGFCYFENIDILYGADISSGIWQEKFQMVRPPRGRGSLIGNCLEFTSFGIRNIVIEPTGALQ